jgi:hypothetical protein
LRRRMSAIDVTRCFVGFAIKLQWQHVTFNYKAAESTAMKCRRNGCACLA